MKKEQVNPVWEYRIIFIGDSGMYSGGWAAANADFLEELNKAGARGWELVNAEQRRLAYMKRLKKAPKKNGSS